MKRRQRIMAMVIVILVALAMIGTYVGNYFISNSNAASSSATSANSAADYKNAKQKVAQISAQAKANPTDLNLQKNLGDAYYDLGQAAQENAPNEVQGDFRQAIQAYQNYLKSNKDIGVEVDMATSAFYSGDYDLADKTYQQALKDDPNFINTYFNYGVFLSHAKNDFAGAVKVWQEGLSKNPTADQAQQLQQLISYGQSELGPAGSAKASSGSGGQSGGTATATAAPGGLWSPVEAIIYQKCITCHGPGGKAADKSLQTYNDVMKYVTPGNINSPLLVKAKDGHDGTSITSAENATLEEWVAHGAGQN